MRKRIKRTTATIVGSSDVRRAKASQEILKAGHEERMGAINQMKFKIANPKVTHKYMRAYVMVWGKKTYIPNDKAEVTANCGMRVYWE